MLSACREKCLCGGAHLRGSLHNYIRFCNQRKAIQNPKLVVINLDTEHKADGAGNCKESLSRQQSV